METWKEIRERHHMERFNLVQNMADKGVTQTEACKLLGVNMTTLNNYIRRNGVNWHTIKQGRKYSDLPANPAEDQLRQAMMQDVKASRNRIELRDGKPIREFPRA